MRSLSFIASLILLAPATTFAASLAERDLTPVAGYNGWTYSGCVSDTVSARTLSGPSYCDDDGMTGQKCIDFCSNKGYHLAGVEYGQECYCGNYLASTSTAKPGDCTMTCHGDSSQPCGNGDRLDVYASPNAAAAENPGTSGYTSFGCYSDSTAGRTLSQRTGVDGPMTVEKCINACAAKGLDLAGVEYGSECYCDSSIFTGRGACPVAGDPSVSGCNMACEGDSSSLCGGPDRINIYHKATSTAPAGFSGPQCFTDSRNSRSLGVGMGVDGGFSQMTVEGCTAACTAAGYGLAGLEYGRECYCASIGDNHGTLASDRGCNVLCTGDSTEICGGEDFISVYTNLAGDPPKPKPSTTTSATPSPTPLTFTNCGDGTKPGNCDINAYCSGSPYACYCGGTPEGPAYCINTNNYNQQGCASAACTRSSDCGSGQVCVTNTCCSHNICVDASTGNSVCPNGTSPKMMFRPRGQKQYGNQAKRAEAKRDGTPVLPVPPTNAAEKRDVTPVLPVPPTES